MKLTHAMALALIAATGGVGVAEARSPRDADPCSNRVVLRRIAAEQAQAAKGVYTPSGYKKVWTDDRLSLRRTHQTFAGKAQMETMWTKTVPRQLILIDT